MYVEDPEVSAFLKHIHIQSIPAKIPVTVSNPFTVCHMLTDGIKGYEGCLPIKIQLIEEDTQSRCACKYVVHYLISMKPITQLLHVYYTVLMIVIVI